MQNKKNQHYVPRFYLKNFSQNGKSIGMYRRSNHLIVECASIRQVACRDHMYGEDGIMEEWLAHCESKWAKALKYLLLQNDTDFEDPAECVFLLLQFISISLARTAKVADGNVQFMDYFKEMFDQVEESGGTLLVDRENAFQGYDCPNKIPIEIANESLTVLADLKALIIMNETTRGFFTSDNPVVLYNLLYAKRKYKVNYGIGSGGIILFLPLNEVLCFCLYDPSVYTVKSEDPFTVSIKSINQINEFNKLFSRNAYESLFWGSMNLPDYVRRMGAHMKVPASWIREYPIWGTKETILRFGADSILNEYQFPFFRISEKYLNLELPMHMGGLIRESAKKFQQEYNARMGFHWGDSLEISK